MTRLRLLADDLTGALDAGAEFVPSFGAIPCLWEPEAAAAPVAVFDSGTRDLDAADAAARFARFAPVLAAADLAFLKVDSLLRGHGMAELAACLRGGAWHGAILAPAFPFQQRVTRGGRQFARDGQGNWFPVGPDLVAALAAYGIPARLGLADEGFAGVCVCDAEDEGDLLQIVAIGRRWPQPPLWCGSGGLARALAGPAEAIDPAPVCGPILGVFGSDQPATAAQLAACPRWHLSLSVEAADHAAAVSERMAQSGCALVSFTLPTGTDRSAAATLISRAVSKLATTLPAPATLLCAGGETLRALCAALGTECLHITGALMPGVPRSRMQGGAWDGTEVISKSGAFGAPDLLHTLLDDAHFAVERIGS